MSQRNPMNDRYQTDEHKGQTRKSASAAKPKTKAASSVRVESTKKTPKEKKAIQRANQEKQRQAETKYYRPNTAEFKKWRRVWWGMLIGAIIATSISALIRMSSPGQEVLSLIVLCFGYVGMVGALVIEFTKIRKIRREYALEMQSKESKGKEERAAKKQEHAETVAARKAKAAGVVEETAEEPKKGGLLSFSRLRGAAQRASDTNKAAAKSGADAGSSTSDADLSDSDSPIQRRDDSSSDSPIQKRKGK